MDCNLKIFVTVQDMCACPNRNSTKPNLNYSGLHAQLIGLSVFLNSICYSGFCPVDIEPILYICIYTYVLWNSSNRPLILLVSVNYLVSRQNQKLGEKAAILLCCNCLHV